MERLTIDEVIEHCERTTKNTELLVRKIPDDNKYYWEHKQVAEWLAELKRYKTLPKLGGWWNCQRGFDSRISGNHLWQ